MPKGYLVAHIRVHDAEGFKKFGEMAMPAIAEYGGKVLVRNPNPEVREGNDSGVAVVIEFETIENALNTLYKNNVKYMTSEEAITKMFETIVKYMTSEEAITKIYLNI